MNWLKDKKNIPIIAAILVVVIILGIGLVVYSSGMFAHPAVAPTAASSSPGAPPTVASASTTMAARGYPSSPSNYASYGAATTAPTNVPSKTATATVARPIVNVKHGPDPFLFSLLRHVKTTSKRQLMADADVKGFDTSTVDVPSLPSGKAADNTVAAPTPVTESANNRVSGIVQTGGVYAIMESNGESKTVQPGDTVDGYKIISIQPDGLTATKVDSGDTIHVPLSSTSTGASGGASGYPGATPYPSGG